MRGNGPSPTGMDRSAARRVPSRIGTSRFLTKRTSYGRSEPGAEPALSTLIRLVQHLREPAEREPDALEDATTVRAIVLFDLVCDRSARQPKAQHAMAILQVVLVVIAHVEQDAAQLA